MATGLLSANSLVPTKKGGAGGSGWSGALNANSFSGQTLTLVY